MARYAVVDLSNLFHRSRHGSMGDTDTKIGLALLIVFRSLRKLYRDLKVDHIVFAVDNGSWRYSIYPAYKSRRRLARLKATQQEQEENESFMTSLSALTTYLDKQTRCTVLQCPNMEGDDFVARWIERHPNDEHIIVSGDSDFVQLLAPNVSICDAINQRMISIDSIVDVDGNKLEFSVSPKDGKIKVGKQNDDFIPEQDWWKKALFVKIIRGDVGDSIFSAFPGVRYEGKKISINAAWADSKEKGYDWNNMMFQSWNKIVGTSAEGEPLTETVRVIDEYHLNEKIINLHMQPKNIVKVMDTAIDEAINRSPPSNVGMYFLKFCKQHDLPSLEKEANTHVEYLNAGYK